MITEDVTQQNIVLKIRTPDLILTDSSDIVKKVALS